MMLRMNKIVFNYDKRNWKLRVDYNQDTSQFDLSVNSFPMQTLPYRAPTQGICKSDCLKGRIRFNRTNVLRGVMQWH